MTSEPPESTPSAASNAGADVAAMTGAPAPMTKKQKRNQIIRSGIGLLATAVIVYFVWKWFQSQGASISQVWADIKGMPAWAVIGLGIATVFNLLVYPTPYQASTIGLKYPSAFTVRQTSFTISNTIPFGGAVGLGVQYGMFGTYAIGPTAIVATLAISSVWTELMTLGLPVLGLIGLAFTGQATSQEVTWAALGAAGVVVIVVLLVIILRSVKGAEWVGRVGQKSLGWFFRLIHKPEPDVTASVLKFRHDTVDVLKARWLIITGTNFLVQLGMFSILYFAVAGLSASTNGHMPSLVECFAAFAISRIGTLVPVPGGLGPTDAILVQLLTSFGVTSTVAVAADLVWRILYFAVQVLVGVLTFIWWQFVASKRHHPAAA